MVLIDLPTNIYKIYTKTRSLHLYVHSFIVELPKVYRKSCIVCFDKYQYIKELIFLSADI